MLKDEKVIRMYNKKATHIATDRYRHLAFQISFFLKQHGYINVADLLTELRDDKESIDTIGEITNLNLKDNYSIEEIDDYLTNIIEYNDKKASKKYKSDLIQEVDLQKKIELAKLAVAYKMRSDEDDR